MILAERHARLRAHDDPDALDAGKRFVLDYFGGDFERAVWFLDEVAKRAGIEPERDKFFSIRNGRVKWHTLRRNT